MRILGVDPGGSGALALLSDDGRRLNVADMPVLHVSRGTGRKTDVDIHALLAIVSEWAPEACFLERVHAHQGDGAASAFAFGEAYGCVRVACATSGARLDRVAPQVWKKELGLIGKAKDDSRARATELWPQNAPDFRRKKDDGRADAALIAEYGRRLLATQGVFG